jgi:hypothetical protein
MTQSLADQVQTFLESDRQWTRVCRIAHAQYQIRTGIRNNENTAFWVEVLKRLED